MLGTVVRPRYYCERAQHYPDYDKEHLTDIMSADNIAIHKTDANIIPILWMRKLKIRRV